MKKCHFEIAKIIFEKRAVNQEAEIKFIKLKPYTKYIKLHYFGVDIMYCNTFIKIKSPPNKYYKVLAFKCIKKKH